jgi:3-deoxy-D-manno-octulosonic-acid transferase
LLLYPFWILHAIQHGMRHRQRDYFRMRLCGFRSQAGEQVWVHASSVGEVRAVAPLVKALLAAGENILFTSFTATGYAAIRSRFSTSLSSGVIPVDSFWHCRSFFRNHRVKLGLVMETELWPELLQQARAQRIELLLINARLSAKTLRRGRLVRAILRSTLGCFDRILARNRSDRAALLELGARPERVDVVGNLKLLRTPAEPRQRLVERDYLLLASSHDDEEQLLLRSRPAGLESPLLVLAPRHPRRRARIEQQIAALGLNYAVRSRGEAISADTEVYLADTLGELEALMAHARVVVMGGSFDNTGGHNLIEPARLGCAIITGPSDANIVADIELLGNGSGVLQVTSIEDCWQRIAELLRDPARATALGREARARLAAQPDVIEQYLAEIRPYL